MGIKERIREVIARLWLENDKFLGCSSDRIFKKLKELGVEISEQEVKEVILELQAEKQLSTREVQSGDRISWVWREGRFEEIIEPGPHSDLIVFPKKELLEDFDDSRVEDVGIYKKEQKLGGSHIEHRFFSREVIERYRDDPRYHFEEWGPSGSIGITDKYFLDDSVSEEDKFSIQSFGYAYDDKGEQVIAVILSDLGSLPLKHQNHWRSFELPDAFKLDPDYIENNFEARPTNRISIFNALCRELGEINKICDLMGEPHLFREDFVEEKTRNFTRLTRPTSAEFLDFVLTLDKMLSDNVNKAFFKDKIPLTEEQISSDGEKRIIDKGTIRLLEEYLDVHWNYPDPKPKKELIDTLKEIRSLRQKPAHKVDVNKYDEGLIRRQEELMIRIYRAVRTLRLILQNHPSAVDYEPPQSLAEGRIL